MSAAPARQVPLGTADVDIDRRADGAILLRSPHPLTRLSAETHRAPGALGGRGPGANLCCAARRRGRLAPPFLRRRPSARARDRPGTARARSVRGAPAGDPFRQRHRARLARACLHARRHRLRAGVLGLLAGIHRPRQAEAGHRPADAGAGIRYRRRALREGDCRGGARGHRGPDRRPVRCAGSDASHRGRGCRARGSRPGHDRQIPAHLRLDRAAQGGDQHATHALQQPADADARAALAARDRRRCWSTGCPGTTPPAATTTSAWCSTTAARCTSTKASRCPA